MSTYIQDFSDASELSYDNTLVEVTGGVAKLKDLTPTDSTFRASYGANINGNWGDGSDLTGTATGGASVSGGYLLLNQNDLRYVDYDADGNADSQQIGCIRFIIKTAYNGTPAADIFLICITKAHNDKDNSIELKHNSANGKIRLIIRDSIGTVITDSDFGTFNPVNTTDYELELNYDLTNGAHRLFIDGTQSGSTLTDIGTRDSDIALFRVGSSYGAATNSNFSVKDLLVFSTVQHTSDYTPTDWSEISATRYTMTNPTVTVTPAQFYMEALEGFAEVSTKTGSDEIKYVIAKGTDWYYHTLGAWAISDETYAQTDTAATIESQKATFTTSRIIFGVKFYLHSDDGSTTPEIDTLTITYNYAGETPDDISTCIVSLNMFQLDNTVGESTFKATLNKKTALYKTNIGIENIEVSDVVDNTGYAELELIETENMEDDTYYIFEVNGKKYAKYVPNQSTKDFWDLVDVT